MTTQDTQQNQTTDNATAGRKPALQLFVPQQAPPPPGSFLQDAKETEAWFAALPMANVGETARRIYSALVDFNRMEFAPVVRARNAEHFRQPVDYICSNLRRHFVDTGFPLSEKGRKAAALARALYQELAISYKSIVMDLLNGSSERFDRKLLIIALHRSLRYLTQVVHYTALVYGPWPDGLWREIHAIYAFALQNRIHRIAVREYDARRSEQSTLDSLYLGMLLFSTAGPYRLRQGQQMALISAVPDWTTHVTLTLPDEGEAGVGRFYVDLFADKPPAQDNVDAPSANRRLRRLDLRRLLKQLRQQFDETPWHGGAGADTKGHSLNRPLLRSLIMSWSLTQERRFVRTRLNFELNVITGLNRLHSFLQQARQEEAEARARDEDSGDRYASRFIGPQDTTPIDPWSEPYSHGLAPATVDAETIPESLFNDTLFGGVLSELDTSEPSTATTPPPADGTVRTLNESAGGYCIQWQGDKLPRVRVGELLGIHSQGGQTEFSLAVIRWIRQEPNRPLQFGVELMAPQCEPAEVVPSGEARSQYPTAAQRCLVIPSSAAEEASPSLVLPSALYAVGATLTLNQQGDRQGIRLTGVVETTGAFARYHYEAVQPRTQTTQNPNEDPDFGDLWNNL